MAKLLAEEELQNQGVQALAEKLGPVEGLAGIFTSLDAFRA